MKNSQEERIVSTRTSGWLIVAVNLCLFIFAAASAYVYHTSDHNVDATGNPVSIFSLPLTIKWIAIGVVIPMILAKGIFSLKPNEGKVFTFTGNYMGTIREAGYHWVPFWWSSEDTRDLSSQVMVIGPIKVNEKGGNPILIGCDIFCHEKDTYKATFDISDILEYLDSKGEVALRHMTMKYPMDTEEENGISLIGSREQIIKELIAEVTLEYAIAGYEVTGASITELSYAPEIASDMLQKQKAHATVAAKAKITDGAVGIIKMTLDKFKTEGITLTSKQQTDMVLPMLINLTSNHPVSPTYSVKPSNSNDSADDDVS
ncbi:MAG: hypothetical protein KA028_02135 [Candidatus Pacebacteria bacterium]|nr:hypothetical protein [Candidatus Paceibacterota bacterium]MBP9851744.1 hypothetical protein [Candidatus Paceibacterota bacterium]